MTAMMVISPPEPGEPTVTVEEIREALEQKGVRYGIDEEVIVRAVAEKTYNTPLKVAGGRSPQKGDNARFEYFFDIDFQGTPQEDKEGRIDYREINSIQNVEKGAILARKIPPTEGVSGIGVDGKEIPAPRGRNFSFKYGANTHLSSDGNELFASASGAIVYSRGVIAIKDVLVIDGDVDFSVGNIDCHGSVKIKGNIQPGFKLNVGGNLEVGGNVHDCVITCQGNVLIKGGCIGKGEGIIRAEGDVIMKFAEDLKILSGGSVSVGGELLNCFVTAREKVQVKGRKGKIIGGEVKAGREIRAAVLGSDAGTVTLLMVAFNCELMKEYQTIVHEIARLASDEQRVKKSLYDLYRLQMDGKLSQKKREVLKQLENFQKSVPAEMNTLKRRKSEIEEKLQEYSDAVIIAEEVIYPGVEAYFGIVHRQVTEVRRRCSLSLVGNQVVFSDFSPEQKQK